MMTAVTSAQQFLFPNAKLGTGRHYAPHVLAGQPSAQLPIPSAGTWYFATDGMLKPGLLNMGIMLQPHGGSIAVSYTLAEKDQVMKDPASVPWSTEPAIADQALVSSGNRVPSVVRIVSTGPLVVYAAAC